MAAVSEFCLSGIFWPQRQSRKENIHIPFSLQLLEAIALLAMVSVVILRVEKSWHRVCNLQLTILYSTFIYNWEKALSVREWHNEMTRDETHNFSVIRAQLRHSQFTVSRRGLSQCHSRLSSVDGRQSRTLFKKRNIYIDFQQKLLVSLISIVRYWKIYRRYNYNSNIPILFL